MQKNNHIVNKLMSSNIALVGGGRFCRNLLKFLFENFQGKSPSILGVADINDQAEGVKYARDKGIFTTNDYKKLFKFRELDVIIELTKDNYLLELIRETKPSGVRFVDHFEAVSLWVSLQIEVEKKKTLKQLESEVKDDEKVKQLFKQYSDKLEDIIAERNDYSQKIAKELVESEKTMSQIIQGSTIPTFVINKNHFITHWNKALENLTGYSAQEMIGTNKQSIPFWEKERPTMADIILEQIEEGELAQYYGENWRRSSLIEGAYEAEIFFPSLGENGRWCFFTAAPIRSPDGNIIGAIETLWDRTEEKKAEEERENYTRELAGLCSIYTSLSSPRSLNERIDSAVEDIRNFISADDVGIFFQDEDEKFYLKHHVGFSKQLREQNVLGEESTVCQVVQTGKVIIYHDIKELDQKQEELRYLADLGFRSLVYIPISAKEKKAFGVIRCGSIEPEFFSSEKENVLELIGNRIGVTVENAILQEQYIRSEEKYRSLFNNDPNPIFIIDSQTFYILDFNQRARDYYGYSRDEFLKMTFLDLGREKDEELEEGLKKLSSNQSILFSKKRHYRKNGLPFYVNINVSSATYADKKVLIATTTDITESVEKEAQLIQASKMTTLGTMVAGMAHEISQPLNVLQVCADYFLKMIKKGISIDQEELTSIADDIIANIKRASGIINHMRDFARQSEVVKTRVNINDPIQDVFKVLGNQLKVHGVKVELDLDPDLPYIIGEHNRLEQVFVNLVINALDALDAKSNLPGYEYSEKHLIIKSYLENQEVVVTVTDTGTGMPKEVKEKIFEPFFTTKEVGKGTGLGVSISYGIVKDFDGTIEVDSEEGEGTTFELRFPALQEKAT